MALDLSEEARIAKREYEKRWREANRDKIRAKNKRYWEKRAASLQQKENDNECETNQVPD